MASSKEIRNRIYNILNDMTAVSGTTKTVANRIPHAIADYEGYVFRVRLVSSSNTRVSREVRNEQQSWLIELFSPKINLGFYDEKEDDMYDYRDTVLDEFQLKTSLGYNGLEMSGVSKSSIQDNRFTWGDTEFNFRYKWQCTLNVESKQSCRS